MKTAHVHTSGQIRSQMDTFDTMLWTSKWSHLEIKLIQIPTFDKTYVANTRIILGIIELTNIGVIIRYIMEWRYFSKQANKYKALLNKQSICQYYLIHILTYIIIWTTVLIWSFFYWHWMTSSSLIQLYYLSVRLVVCRHQVYHVLAVIVEAIYMVVMTWCWPAMLHL